VRGGRVIEWQAPVKCVRRGDGGHTQRRRGSAAAASRNSKDRTQSREKFDFGRRYSLIEMCLRLIHQLNLQITILRYPCITQTLCMSTTTVARGPQSTQFQPTNFAARARAGRARHAQANVK
jgi:hypothetical protein